MQKHQNSKDTKKIVLTGGHAATPILAMVEKFAQEKPNWQLYWIGPISAMETAKVETATEKVLRQKNVIIKTIVAGRALKKGKFLIRLKSYMKIPVGFIHALQVVGKIKPDLIISFGGFAGLPVVIASWLVRKPIIIHEQVAGAGLANRLSAPFAKKIAISRIESKTFFSESKIVVTGNPQISKFFTVKPKTKMGTPPTLFITGGSTGAEVINKVIDLLLEDLLVRYNVIHQTGDNNIDYYTKRREQLPKELQSKYQVFGYMEPQRFVECFERADIIISRAGANTVSDILITRRPAILIPIPWAIGDEQRRNAQKAVKAGIAIILEQEMLTPETLTASILQIAKAWPEMVKKVTPDEFLLDIKASDKLFNLVLNLLDQ